MKKFQTLLLCFLISSSYTPLTFAQASQGSAGSSTPQTGNSQADNARALLEASLGFIKQKIKESGYALTEEDIGSIKRSENTFSIPKRLRLKGIASIPMIQEQAVVRKIKYSVPSQNNQLSGFSFVSIQSTSVLAKLGLQKGDIIYKVNGEVVNDTDTATKIFNKVKGSDDIQVEIIRQNKVVNLRYLFV